MSLIEIAFPFPISIFFPKQPHWGDLTGPLFVFSQRVFHKSIRSQSHILTDKHADLANNIAKFFRTTPPGAVLWLLEASRGTWSTCAAAVRRCGSRARSLRTSSRGFGSGLETGAVREESGRRVEATNHSTVLLDLKLLLRAFDSCLEMLRDLLRMRIQQDVFVQKGESARSRVRKNV